MKINIKGIDIDLKISFKAFLLYEQLTEKSFSSASITEVVYFFFSVVYTSDKSKSIKFDDFIDWLDDNPKKLKEFNEFVDEYTSRSDDVEKEEEQKEELGEEVKKN